MKKEIITFIGIIVLVAITYKMGQTDANISSREISLQKKIDSLKTLSSNANEKWSEIKEMNEEKNKKIEQALKSISQSKTIIKYEIIQNTKKISSLNDSAVQHFIDSIRTNGGFR